MSHLSECISIRPSFAAVVCAGLYFGDAALVAVFLLASLLHELGHILAVKLLGAQIRHLTLSCAGAELTLLGEGSYGRDLLLCISGPTVNLVLALWTENDLFAGVNLLLGMLNLMPIRGLDGGNALYAVLAWIAGPKWGERLVKSCSVLCSGAVVSVGAWVLFGLNGMPWLLLLGIWLCVVAWR